MGERVVYCGECGKELYRLGHIVDDKPSQCLYCKSTMKSYVTHGLSKGCLFSVSTPNSCTTYRVGVTSILA